MDPSYKLDEGYSEDTRSQDGLESPNVEMGNDALLASQLGVGGVLPPEVMALSEAERSGVLALALLRRKTTSWVSVLIEDRACL